MQTEKLWNALSEGICLCLPYPVLQKSFSLSSWGLGWIRMSVWHDNSLKFRPKLSGDNGPKDSGGRRNDSFGDQAQAVLQSPLHPSLTLP